MLDTVFSDEAGLRSKIACQNILVFSGIRKDELDKYNITHCLRHVYRIKY